MNTKNTWVGLTPEERTEIIDRADIEHTDDSECSVYELAQAIEAKLREKNAVQGEPVAYLKTWHKDGVQHADIWQWESGIESLKDGNHYLYTTPQPAVPERKPLTDEEIYSMCRNEGDEHSTCFIFNKDRTWSVLTLARAIEAAHGIKE